MMRLETYGKVVALGGALRAHVERRLGFALGRLRARVARVRVFLADLRGPRGGLGKRCRMVAYLARAGQVVVEHRAGAWGAAVDGAAGRLGHTVRRRLALRRRWRRRGPRAGRGDDPGAAAPIGFIYPRRYDMRCPVCADELRLSDHQGIELGRCPRCNGAWLDHARLDQLLARSWPGRAGTEPPAAPDRRGPGREPLDVSFYDFG
jgi:Zn-finger nucleic acid-binding protein